MKWPFSLFDSVAPPHAYGFPNGPRRNATRASGCNTRLLIAAAIAVFAVFQYFTLEKSTNEFTGREQRLHLKAPEEIQLGLNSAPQMAQQFGGLSTDQQATTLVKQIGAKLVDVTDADHTPYGNHFEFHLLADRKTVNAFALPGGQIFITEALLHVLESEDELAGVLGHEIGHVVGRHSSEQIGKSNLTQRLVTAVAMGVDDGSGAAARTAQMVGQFVNMRYGRGDELEADRLAVLFLLQADYQPEAMIGVMDKLEKASGGGGQPEMMSTHPSSENRRETIRAEIERFKREGFKRGTINQMQNR